MTAIPASPTVIPAYAGISPLLRRGAVRPVSTISMRRVIPAKAALGENDALDGMDVLPGFSCPVRDVFGA